MNESGARLTKLYDRYPHTDLLGGENAKCVIVIPRTDTYRRMADKINAALPVPLPVMDDDLVATEGPRPWHVLALGNLTNNRLLGDLYLLERVCCDMKFPGDAGYVMRTVHNPFLNGRNVVELGGSNETGVGRAVDHLVQIVEARTAVLEPTLEVSLPAGSSARTSTDDLRAWEGMTAKGDMSSLGVAISGCASSLFRTGCVEAGGILRGAIRPFLARVRERWEEVSAGAGSPENMSWHIVPGSELISADRVPMAWQNVEDLPVFTDDDRLAMAEAILLLAEISTFGLADFPPTPGYHGNMRPAIASFLLGLYVARHYSELEVGRRILERADRYYGANLRHWKPVEDAPSYAMSTTRENLLYVRHRPAWHWFDTGPAWQWADYCMRISDNRGIIPGVGDSGETDLQDLLLPLCAWRYGDGEFAWAALRGCPDRTQFHVDVEPVRPDDMVGVDVLPLDRWIYERPRSGTKSEDITAFDVTLALPEGHETRKNWPPHDVTFDKIVLRGGFSPNDPYLLLSGFNYGHHSHIDGNAICAFVERNKLWLFDHGYMVPQLQEHCTVVITHNGRWKPPPERCHLFSAVDMPRAAHVASCLGSYNDVLWVRHIVHAKERATFVIDSLYPEKPGEYGIQAVWRTLGDVELDGNALSSTQGDDRLRLVHPGHCQLTLRDCAYQFRDLPCGALYETLRVDVVDTEDVYIENVFWTEALTSPVDREVRRAGPGEILIRDRDGLAMAGDGGVKMGHIETAASSFFLNEKCLSLANVDELIIGGLQMGCLAEMNLEWDLCEDKITLRVAEDTLLLCEHDRETGEVTMEGVPVGEKMELDGVPVGGMVFVEHAPVGYGAEVSEGEHLLTLKLEQCTADLVREHLERAWKEAGERPTSRADEPMPARSATELAQLTSMGPVEALSHGDVDGDGEDEIALATFDGSVHVLDAGGSALLSATFDDGCNDVAVADVDGDGRAEVLVGTKGGDVVCLSADGAELWRHSETADGWIPYGLSCPEIVRLYPLDLDGDGQTEILVSIGGMKLLALNGAGEVLWRGAYKGRFTTDAFVVQLPGDDERSLLIGNSYFSAARHNQQGKGIEAITMTWHAGPNRLRFATIPNDGRTVLALGDLMGRIQFTPWLPDERRFDTARGSGPQHETGGTVTVLEWMEPPEGEPFWIAGGRSEHVHCFRPDGTLAWWQYLDDIPIQVWLTARECPQIALLTERGEVVRLSLDGQEVRRESLGARVERSVSMALPDGETRPVAACEDGKILCVG